MSTSGQWLRSPHVARADGGPEALAAFRKLAEAESREVVRFGDELAEASLAVAQAYALRAPAARARLDREHFAAWAKRAIAIATGAAANREAAIAYLHLDAIAIASAPRALVDRWLELAVAVQAVSRKLAVLFVEGTGPAIGSLGRDGVARLEAWAAAGLELASTTGWRGEFLAAAFFAAGPAVLPALSASDVRRWAALGAAAQSGRDLGQTFFRALPTKFGALAAPARAAIFALCRAAAASAPKSALALFESLPVAVARLEPSVASALLAALGTAARDTDGLVALVPFLEPIVAAIPTVDRLALLERVAETGARLPHVVVPLLRSLPRALDQAGPRAVRGWIVKGEAIGEANADAARAYFALESRTALRVLREGSAAVHFDEVQAVLRCYVRMLSGRTLAVTSADGVSLRPFLDRESLDRSSIALPAKVDFYDAWEDNFSILKLAAAGGVGRLLYGTYDLSIARVRERLPADLGEVLAAKVDGDGLANLLDAVPEADPLLPLFAACEGARIDRRLARAYRGFAAELANVAGRLARRVPRRRRSAELVLFLVGAGYEPQELATEELPSEVLATVAKVLGGAEATVDDALAVAVQVRERLADSITISGFGPPTTYDELLLEQMLAEAAFERDDGGDDGTREKPGPNAIVDVEPKAVEEGDEEGPGTPLSPEELRRLLEAGAILKIGKSTEAVESAGIFAKNLKLPPGAARDLEDERDVATAAAGKGRHGRGELAGFQYDEWDYTIRDYRVRWCHLEELSLGADAGEFFQDTLTRYADVLPDVRRQFQRLRPERYQKVRGLEDGEDFDLNAAVEARVELAARRSPSARLYVARRPEERDVASLFLLDMSASTDEPLVKNGGEPAPRGEKPRRIIDVTKEALVVMAEALQELGDRYAIYGFSGQGRDNVEFYVVKQFQEGLTARVRGRIGAIEPRRSTRMGTALRHARMKMANVTSRSKHIFLLSDGFPQDFDYGTDRRSNTYGIQDTMMALQECQAAGITPFCITVDKTGHDYLRQMCETSRYLVLEDVASLPNELPKIYERWVRA
jgi:hypothetical protein